MCAYSLSVPNRGERTLSVNDKFESNTHNNMQLTREAFVEAWQTSGTINQVEERIQTLIEEHRDENDIAAQELADKIKEAKHVLIDAGKLTDIEYYSKEWHDLRDEQQDLYWEAGRAGDFLTRYDRPDGADRYRNRFSYSRPNTSKIRADRLIENSYHGVQLRPLRRIHPKEHYYSQLNEYAQSFR